MIPAIASCESDFIRAASPIAVENSLRSVGRRIRRWKRWLNIAHPYSDVIDALESESIDAAKLGEYIACSVPLHLADGWNYLSRAFDAASRGDRYSAYHLAYYAELRAAMSLLASEGVGVFRNRHIALNRHFQAKQFGMNTHRATWRFLSAWSREPGRAVSLLDAISVESKTLSQWLEAVGVTDPARQVVAAEWLRAWSIDLETLSEDPARRNEMSYRPARIRAPAPPPVDPLLELAEPLFHSWTALEPSADRASVALDLSLLRQAFILVVEKGLCTYSTLGATINSLKDQTSDTMYRALHNESPSATAIFGEAKVTDVRGRAATPILARSLLMLRLASARAASLLTAAEVSKANLEFWWSALGTDLGLWESAADIETLSDLWIEVAEARDAAGARISSAPGSGSVHTVSGILSREVSLTQFSRAPMWLLGLD